MSPCLSHAKIMTIREATASDLPAIVAIYNESIPGGMATADLEPITPASREAWFQEFTPDRRPCWVAEDNGTIIGTVYLRSFYGGRPAYHKTAEISIYLTASHQGQGLGKTLIQKMIDACPRLEVENLLSFYFAHNTPSRQLFQDLGFQECGYLPGIAEVFGHPRDVIIAHLHLPNRS